MFDASDWVEQHIRKFNKIKHEEGHYFIKAVGNKDEMVATIEYLMAELSSVRDELIKHAESKK